MRRGPNAAVPIARHLRGGVAVVRVASATALARMGDFDIVPGRVQKAGPAPTNTE